MKRIVVDNKKILALFLVCLSIFGLTIFELYHVLAIPAPSRTTIVEPGSLADGCDVIVYSDSGTYLVRNNTGANIASSSSSDGGPILQTAISDTPIGGELCIGGEIRLATGVIISQKMTVTGNVGPIFQPVLGTTRFKVAFNGTAITVGANGVRLTSLDWRSTASNQGTAIGTSATAQVTNVIVDYNSFHSFNTAINLQPSLQNTLDWNLDHNLYTACTFAVLGFVNTSTGKFSNEHWLTNSYFLNSPVKAGNEADIWHIAENVFWGSSTVNMTTLSTGSLIHHNLFEQNTGTGLYIGGLSRGNGGNANNIDHNYFDGMSGGASAPIVYLNGQDNWLTDNLFDISCTATYDLISTGGLYPPNRIFGNRFRSGKMGTLDTFNILKDNYNYNPVSLITNPFSTGGNNFVGIGGSTAAPGASTNYVIVGVDIFITSAGGTGISIRVSDAAGNTIQSGLTTLTQMWLPVGYIVNWGAFSVAPTVTVWGN